MRSIENREQHPTLCPGVYRMTAWAKYSSDYDGWQSVINVRFTNVEAGTPAENFSHHSGKGQALGAFPTRPDQWQRIEATKRTTFVNNKFQWFVGYPVRGSVGKMWITDLQATRLGGDGSC